MRFRGNKPPGCQVEGCNADLQQLSPYFQQKRICPAHMHADEVCCGNKAGLWRYCQQCGRLQPLDKFDGTKRSCRDSLERRRYQPSRMPAGLAAQSVSVSSKRAGGRTSRPVKRSPRRPARKAQHDQEMDEEQYMLAAQHAPAFAAAAAATGTAPTAATAAAPAGVCSSFYSFGLCLASDEEKEDISSMAETPDPTAGDALAAVDEAAAMAAAATAAAAATGPGRHLGSTAFAAGNTAGLGTQAGAPMGSWQLAAQLAGYVHPYSSEFVTVKMAQQQRQHQSGRPNAGSDLPQPWFDHAAAAPEAATAAGTGAVLAFADVAAGNCTNTAGRALEYRELQPPTAPGAAAAAAAGFGGFAAPGGVAPGNCAPAAAAGYVSSFSCDDPADLMDDELEKLLADDIQAVFAAEADAGAAASASAAAAFTAQPVMPAAAKARAGATMQPPPLRLFSQSSNASAASMQSPSIAQQPQRVMEHGAVTASTHVPATSTATTTMMEQSVVCSPAGSTAAGAAASPRYPAAQNGSWMTLSAPHQGQVQQQLLHQAGFADASQPCTAAGAAAAAGGGGGGGMPPKPYVITPNDIVLPLAVHGRSAWVPLPPAAAAGPAGVPAAAQEAAAAAAVAAGGLMYAAAGGGMSAAAFPGYPELAAATNSGPMPAAPPAMAAAAAATATKAAAGMTASGAAAPAAACRRASPPVAAMMPGAMGAPAADMGHALGAEQAERENLHARLRVLSQQLIEAHVMLQRLEQMQRMRPGAAPVTLQSDVSGVTWPGADVLPTHTWSSW